jgi:hypothetical protein
MSLPVSSTWDLADFSGSALGTLLYLGSADMAASPSIAPYFTYNTNSTVLYAQSDDGAEASITLTTAVPARFTFEAVVRFPALPNNFGDLASRRCGFIVSNGTGRGIAIYFSKAGVAVSRVDDYGSTVALPDTDFITEEISSSFFTVRVAVDGGTGRAYVLASEGVTDQPSLRWIVPVDVAPPGSTDSFRLVVKGLAAEPVDAEFTSIRLSSDLVLANYPPVADAGADKTTTLGQAVRLDGRSSYDVEGGALAYRWVAIDAPFGSQYAADVGTLTTTDDGDADGTTAIITAEVSALPVWLSAGDVVRLQGEVYVIESIDTGTGEITTTLDTVPDDIAGEPGRFVKQGILLEANTETPTVVPDIAGIYRFRLTVNDGESDSEPSEVLVSVSEASLPMGIEPNVSAIWKAIGDEYRFIPGRTVFEEAWRGVAQILAGKLLEAWQYHYNGSIKDAQRIFQRKWVAYRTLETETDPDSVEIGLRLGNRVANHAFEIGDAAVTGEDLEITYFDGLDEEVITVTFTGGSLSTIVSEINTALASTPLANLADTTASMDLDALLRHESTCTTTADGDGDGKTTVLTVAASSLPAWIAAGDVVVVANTRHRVASFNNGAGTITVSTDTVPDNLNGATYRLYRAARLRLLGTKPFKLAGDAAATLGLVTGLNYLEGTQGVRVTDRSFFVDAGTDLITQGVQRDDLLVLNNGQSFRVDRVLSDPLDPVANQRVLVYDDLPLDASPDWQLPSVVRGEAVDYERAGVYPGDLAKIEIYETEADETTHATGYVVSQKDTQLAVRFREDWVAAAHASSDFELRFLGVKRRKAIPIAEDVVSIPRLQEVLPVSLEPEVWRENVDYILEPFYRDTDGEPLPMLQFKDTVWIDTDTEPPDVFWAELTLYDNASNVEDLFGRLVGFYRDDAAGFPRDFNYVSGVAGLLYAQQRGPRIFSAIVGAQILLGQPFAEVAGYVEEIRTDYSPTMGRIILRDDDGNVPTRSEILRAYYYKKNPLDLTATSGLAADPETGELWAVGSLVPQFSPLGAGIEVLDNYSDPDWWIPYVRSGVMTELEKFHTFLVQFNTDLVTVANAHLLQALITRIKPTYTKAIIAGARQHADDIDAEDDLDLEITYHLNDSTEGIAAFMYDDYGGDGLTESLFDDGYTYFDGRVDCPNDTIEFVLELPWAGGVIALDLPIFYAQPVTDVTGAQTGTPGNTFVMTNGMALAAGTYRVTYEAKSQGVVLP